MGADANASERRLAEDSGFEGLAEEGSGMLEELAAPAGATSLRATKARRALAVVAAAALVLAGVAAVRHGMAPAHSEEPEMGTELVIFHRSEEGQQSSALPTTTVTPTTSVDFPNSTKDWPSLFCWLVSQTVGGKENNRVFGWMEEKLVWEMYMRKIGLFACNDFAVFTDQKCIVSKMEPWGWPYVADDYEPNDGEVLSWPLGSTQTARNGDSSPSNVWVFVSAWKALSSSGKLKSHQFVVKQDPDAVFCPWRVRWHANQWPSKAGTVPFFVKNCPGFGSMQGPLEIFSIALVNAFLPAIDYCGGGSAGEDSKMEKCAQQFGQPVMDGTALDDQYCTHAAPNCWDGGKIAFHPFKSTELFGQCHENTVQAEKDFKR